MENIESIRIFTRPSAVEGPGFAVPNPQHVEQNTRPGLVPDAIGQQALSSEVYGAMGSPRPRVAAELSRDLGLSATSTIRWQAVLNSRQQ